MMRIKSLQIRNYKSFLASAEILFSSGFNVIVGQNNVGKTALIEALSLWVEDHPHRSFKSLPGLNYIPDPISTVNLSFEISADELEKLYGHSIRKFQMQLPKDHPIEQYESNLIEFLCGFNEFKCTFRSGKLSSAICSKVWTAS